MSRIFFVLFVLLLVGCSESLDIQLDPEVIVFLSDGSEKKIHLSSKDKAYITLNEWLGEHRSGWSSTSGRYPGGIYLRSGNYGIQVTETHVILYSVSSREPRAIYIQKIGKGELDGIVGIGK